jgi:hypothetical protein
VFNATFNNISIISWRSVLLMEDCSASVYVQYNRDIACYLNKTLAPRGINEKKVNNSVLCSSSVRYVIFNLLYNFVHVIFI